MYSRLVYMPLEYEIVKRLKELERLDVRGLQFQPSAVKLMGKIAIQKGYFASEGLVLFAEVRDCGTSIGTSQQKSDWNCCPLSPVDS